MIRKVPEGCMLITAQQYWNGYFVPGMFVKSDGTIRHHHQEFVLVEWLPRGEGCIVRDPAHDSR